MVKKMVNDPTKKPLNVDLDTDKGLDADTQAMPVQHHDILQQDT